jgi:hypothetical protein
MERVGIFLAGVATGWAVRTTVDSSRTLAVKVISTFYGVVDRASRAVGMEREHLEDLLAEARAHYEARQSSGRAGSAGASGNSSADDRARPAARSGSARPAAVSAQGRAA